MSYRALVQVVSPAFFPLGLLARLPYACSPLAALIMVQGATGSFTFAGAAGAAQFIAIAAGGPIVGALADRCGHRLIGVVTSIANILALVGLMAATQAGRTAMLGAAVLAGLTQPQVGPLVRVHWSHLLHSRGKPDLLPTALSYESAADETGFVLGPAIVGLLTPITTPLGPIVPMLATIALLAGATLPFSLLHSSPRGPRQADTTGKHTRLPRLPLAAMVLAMAAMGAIFGALQTGVAAYSESTGQPAATGLIYAEFGIGSALAGAACAWLPARFTLRRRYLVFSGSLLLGTLTLFAGGTLFSLPVSVAVASLTVAPYMICLYALTERIAPPAKAAVAMTILCAGGPLGTAAGRAAAGWLADRHGSAGAFAVAPIVAALALILAVALVFLDRRRGGWLGMERDLVAGYTT
ncbi:MFS family permease [Kibdelosporangium banguiense]|uniref:MFS family permease n=1 Tax=Kibdelosporangium banguiense TaxID=1365924 RepID=A0ABS4U1Y6_9PSEU|nr:MFS transporter [Kibdelosporangium banguiense]MBP2330645.1 MFS family permease [Kibdelosporangium banguiense]